MEETSCAQVASDTCLNLSSSQVARIIHELSEVRRIVNDKSIELKSHSDHYSVFINSRRCEVKICI